jgi:hypothetical protein
MVLVDTSVWSLALRRRPRDLNSKERLVVQEWMSLVRSGRAILAGPIRQELLSGLRRQQDFDALRERLSAFACIAITPDDYDQAAAFFNTCRGKGMTAAPIDVLLCAVAARLDIPIFTTDADFTRYQSVLPIALHRPAPGKE